MIPKIIHYCWLSGDPFNETQQKCFDSWQARLPDYQFIKWDKERCRAIQSSFYHRMLRQKKWAYASDYVRLYALYHFGGIYLDIDVEVLKPFDDILAHRVIIGLEDDEEEKLGCHLIGAERGHPFIKKNLQYYDSSFRIRFSHPPVMPLIVTKVAKTFRYHSKQTGLFDEGVRVFPAAYFSPISYKKRKIFTQKGFPKSYAVHYWEHSWYNSKNTPWGRIKELPWLFMGLRDWKNKSWKKLFW